jgi:integrase/recombinase XerD
MSKTQRSFDPNTRLMKPGFLNSPLTEFLKDLSQRGYTRLSIEGYAMSIAHFGAWAEHEAVSLKTVNERVVARFAKHRCRCPGGRRYPSVSAIYVRRVRRFVHYLQERGLTPCAELRQRPEVDWPLAQPFTRWLHEHRGVGSITTGHHIEQLKKMPRWLLRAHKRHLNAAGIRSLVLERAPGQSGSARRWMTTALRMYLRFLGSTGRCVPGLEGAVPSIPQWRLSSLPRYLPPDQVEQLIAVCDTTSVLGVRDRAVLLLLSRLGLRAGDVAALRFDDFDWRSARVKVCGKAHRETWLPLPQDAGDAVLEYLTKRPSVAFDRVFLCANAPHRPISYNVVSSIVDHALHSARIKDAPSRGASLLRHSAATSMLRAGATLDTVSAMLRHRSLDMTVHYAKVDLPMLERIVQPWPEGASC